MEVDFPSRNASRRLPILDMEMLTEEGEINFHFYQKPMSSRALVMPRYFITTRDTKNILLEEGGRRLRSCAPSLPWATKAAVLTRFSEQMIRFLCYIFTETAHWAYSIYKSLTP